ncbi:MAG TPA: SDR family oxidoreductase [Caldilineaceae bacterium]|nr:SDR family oxidoreductase [Caldilineaceae bacterium]
MVQQILLTGGSGVVGQALLKQLAAEPSTDYQMICLTRQRPLTNGNLMTIPGDICQSKLGLDDAMYKRLATQVDWIIHAAAITDFAQPFAALRRCNVIGARNMLAFAKAANAPMIHVSTAFVQPRRGHRFNAYELSKREAEAVVQQSDVPVTIVRPSIIVGDSATGCICKQQGMHRIMSLLLEGVLPVVPGSPAARIDFVPQDRVAAALLALLRHQRTGGEYWLTAGQDALSLQDGLDILFDHGSHLLQRAIVKPRLVSAAAFAATLRQNQRLVLSAHQRQQVEESMGLFHYMTMSETFPTSFSRLYEEIGLAALPDPQLTFQRTLEYMINYNREKARP